MPVGVKSKILTQGLQDVRQTPFEKTGIKQAEPLVTRIYFVTKIQNPLD